MILNIFICGIGGQGAVFLGSFLRNFFLRKYPNALILGTESRGVSQREGSVIASVRIQTDLKSRAIFSPEIPPMGADIVIALEPLELLRNFSIVHRNTIIFTNNEPLIPKSSAQWMLQKTSNIEGTNVISHSKPKWLMNRVEQMIKENPVKPKSEKILLKINDSNGSLLRKFQIQSYSNASQIMDVNFSTLILDEFEGSSQLNLVMLGFVSYFLENTLQFRDLLGFIDDFYVNEISKERNKKGLEFGGLLAQHYEKMKEPI
ncbi:MAG: hypothetical protein EU530_09010 [Promethearchaeota archaeon]|nr:MAG: hypothetical protein EU530_09010 [Candidatus Lokiarchaeota archaeon]